MVAPGDMRRELSGSTAAPLTRRSSASSSTTKVGSDYSKDGYSSLSGKAASAKNPSTFCRWVTRANQQAAPGSITGLGRSYSVADDPDHHFFQRGLGRLDDGESDYEDDDDEEFGLVDLGYDDGMPVHANNNLNAFPTGQDKAPEDEEVGAELKFAQLAQCIYSRPNQSFDIRRGSTGLETQDDQQGTDPENLSETESDETDASLNDAAERYEWQHLLGHVLEGEVLKSEKSRIQSKLADQSEDVDKEKERIADEIWLKFRAHVRGRSIEQELAYLSEARLQIDEVTADCLSFRVSDMPGSDPDRQVEAFIRRLDWCESLYPSIRRLQEAKAVPDQVHQRVDALLSWRSISTRLKTQIRILQRWTGNERLEVTRPRRQAHDGTEFSPTGSMSIPDTSVDSDRKKIIDTSTFVERLLKEDSLTKTFGTRTLQLHNSLVTAARTTLVAHHELIVEMNLPSFMEDLVTVAAFPASLIYEALRLRLEYVQKVNFNDNPSIVLIDQITDGFRTSLTLACQIKQLYIASSQPLPEIGWKLPDLEKIYDETLLETLRFFCKLLHWKLKSESKSMYLKETEIVEGEWKFLTDLSGSLEQIQGGDMLVAEHFSMLTHRLMQRVVSYFTEQLEVLRSRPMTDTDMTRWFSQTLDNVRVRHIKLMRFGRSMLQRFTNSSEYYLDAVDVKLFINALTETDHFFVYTGVFEAQGIYIVATPSLQDRPDMVRRILTRCFSVISASESAALTPEGDEYADSLPAGPAYILLLTPRDPFLWSGRVMNLEINKLDLDLPERRVRLVCDGRPESLFQARLHLLEQFPIFRSQVACERMAHLANVNRELKKIRMAGAKLVSGIVTAVDRVREVTKHTEGQEILLANYFSFAADLGQRSVRNMEPRFKAKLIPQLIELAIKWVAFISADCTPSDSRTFKWAVQALEFAMTMTRGDNILRLDTDDFARLRSDVANCMTLLISHFDILGARSSFEIKKDKEKESAASEEMKAQMRERLLRLKTMAAKCELTNSKDALRDAGYRSLFESMHIVADRWAENARELDEQRQAVDSEMRMIGHVLDKNRAEDRGLLFLAASASNISIRWQQGRYIGGGTFGSVYVAVNLESGDLMAVKEIRFQDLASAPTVIKQIRDEMLVMEMLKHPNIVEYYGIEVHRDKVFIFEELCQGGSLATLLEHGRIEDESIIQIYTYQMLDGLMYLHTKNIVHRDIKPDNVLLDKAGVIKLVDFGAAKVLAQNQKTMAARSRVVNPNPTGPGALGPNGMPEPGLNSLTGTPMWMSPEVIKGENRGRKGAMDIWALGCVVLQCATGKLPWDKQDNEWAIMFQIGIATKHPPLPEPHELSELGINFIKECLNLDPEKRASAAELMQHPWMRQFEAETGQSYADEVGESEDEESPLARRSKRAEASALEVVGEEDEEYVDSLSEEPAFS
ncbi:uncharacterized protein L969DRAFT_91060 [Mixia osmundae IAM 14324]|uniref:Protein kinase domain-containing protein n=1 Tax=Mixia osmundae (strain CBS 9802 / IAM 14324 / JCM 22182 / KY 12970) TaxID=764103 RepID=G7DUI8_MIXOS|nr:uncharacterized protein L969DRAFT_91060 [Mixia osmundae IAM 14324]KEI36417.1 hypothetical protein L969DRAFT_91060 [Mixia osmundae IAM 14324]GAA94248.1 hypothetical protein E5Q_00897 [Mixia osmundae IAM 14324]